MNIVKDVTYVSVLTLKNIVFKDADKQSVGFNRQIKSWMQQWTVEKNYGSIIGPALNAYYAPYLWAQKFLADFNNAMVASGTTYQGYDYTEDFDFEWFEGSLEMNKIIFIDPRTLPGNAIVNRAQSLAAILKDEQDRVTGDTKDEGGIHALYA